MARETPYKLLRRFKSLIEKVDTLGTTKEKLGFVRFKPLFSDYNSCIEELKSTYPTKFEQLGLEELPLYDAEGKEQFTVSKLSTLLHQSKSVIAFLEGQLPASDNNLEFPDKVTLAWLWEKVPAKFWCSLLGLLITFFLFGITVGQVTWVGELFGNKSPKGESSSQIAITGTPKRVTISSNEIVLSGPGTYLVDTENNVNSDDLKKIYGLSEGDKVTLKAADDDRTIVIKKGHYLKMQADFSLDNEDDFIILISKGSNICAQYQREHIGD